MTVPVRLGQSVATIGAPAEYKRKATRKESYPGLTPTMVKICCKPLAQQRYSAFLGMLIIHKCAGGTMGGNGEVERVLTGDPARSKLPTLHHRGCARPAIWSGKAAVRTTCQTALALFIASLAQFIEVR